jgi:hypothetical protein
LELVGTIVEAQAVLAPIVLSAPYPEAPALHFAASVAPRPPTNQAVAMWKAFVNAAGPATYSTELRVQQAP